jgi:hypothetical protein
VFSEEVLYALGLSFHCRAIQIIRSFGGFQSAGARDVKHGMRKPLAKEEIWYRERSSFRSMASRQDK